MKFLFLIFMLIGCNAKDDSLSDIEIESFYWHATDPLRTLNLSPSLEIVPSKILESGGKYYLKGKVNKKTSELVSIETLKPLEKSDYEKKCKVLRIENLEIKKGEKYFVIAVAFLRRRIGPAKFDTLGFVPDIKKVEKTFSVKEEFVVKDIAKGVMASVFTDAPEHTFYQISDEFWVEQEALTRNLEGCSTQDKFWAGQGEALQIKPGIKLVDDAGEWVNAGEKLYCYSKMLDEIECQYKMKKVRLPFKELEEKLEPVRI